MGYYNMELCNWFKYPERALRKDAMEEMEDILFDIKN